MNDSAKIQKKSPKCNSCPESRASLSRITCIPSSLIMYLLDATRPERAEAPSPGRCPGLGASALSGRVPTYPQLRPDAVGATSRRIAICVGTWLVARRHVSPAASGCNLGCVGTQYGGHRQANEGEKVKRSTGQLSLLARCHISRAERREETLEKIF